MTLNSFKMAFLKHCGHESYFTNAAESPFHQHLIIFSLEGKLDVFPFLLTILPIVAVDIEKPWISHRILITRYE